MRLGNAVMMAAWTTLSACSDRTTSGPAIPPPPTTIAVAYCRGFEPTWVAFQDGDGAWTEARPSVNGDHTTFRYGFSANRGGIATTTLFRGSVTSLSVQYGTPAELATAGDTTPRDCGPVVSKTLLATVAGLDTNEFASIAAGFAARASVRPTLGDSFALGGLLEGPQDVLATRTTSTNGTNAVVTAFILRRNLDLPDSATLPVFDFASPEAFAPAVATLSIEGLGPEGATGGTRLLTSHADMPVTFLTTPVASATRPYFTLPESRLLPGELQVLFVAASPTPDRSGRTATLYFRTPADRTVTLGASVTPPTFTTVATAPALRLRAQFAPQHDYDRSTTISYQQGPEPAVGSPTTLVTVSMTAAYAALTGAEYDLVVPDLSGAAGFNSAWALRAGGTLLWTAVRIGGTLGLGRDAVPDDGATLRSGFRTDAIPAR